MGTAYRETSGARMHLAQSLLSSVLSWIFKPISTPINVCKTGLEKLSGGTIGGTRPLVIFLMFNDNDIGALCGSVWAPFSK